MARNWILRAFEVFIFIAVMAHGPGFLNINVGDIYYIVLAIFAALYGIAEAIRLAHRK